MASVGVRRRWVAAGQGRVVLVRLRFALSLLIRLGLLLRSVPVLDLIHLIRWLRAAAALLPRRSTGAGGPCCEVVTCGSCCSLLIGLS